MKVDYSHKWWRLPVQWISAPWTMNASTGAAVCCWSLTSLCWETDKREFPCSHVVMHWNVFSVWMLLVSTGSVVTLDATCSLWETFEGFHMEMTVTYFSDTVRTDFLRGTDLRCDSILYLNSTWTIVQSLIIYKSQLDGLTGIKKKCN